MRSPNQRILRPSITHLPDDIPREVKGAIRRQILLVFFIPLVMAMVHISMAFPLIRRLLLLFGMANTKLYVGCTAGTVLAFALVYGLIYSMTARSYYKIVEKA